MNGNSALTQQGYQAEGSAKQRRSHPAKKFNWAQLLSQCNVIRPGASLANHIHASAHAQCAGVVTL